jgi:hypothetical protein
MSMARLPTLPCARSSNTLFRHFVGMLAASYCICDRAHRLKHALDDASFSWKTLPLNGLLTFSFIGRVLPDGGL